MDPGVIGSYLPTLARYLAVALGLGVIMFVAYRVQLALGVKHEAATGRALVAPWVIGFLVFQVFTIGASLYLSFTRYNLFQPPQWIGLGNYTELFEVSAGGLQSKAQRSAEVLAPRHAEVLRVEVGDGGFVFGARRSDFWRSLRLTLPYAFLQVALGLLAALCIALLLNQKVKGLGFWRVLYYAPAILPAVALALLMRWIFSPQSGLLNLALSPFLHAFNLKTPNWFTDPNLALPAFILIGLWGAFGANSVILLAGLKGIPKELYEAASIDGAGDWGKFRNVTLPMLSPSLFYNLVTSTIAAIQIFEVSAFIPTSDYIGTFLNWRIYTEAFTFRNMGTASAMGWIMLIIILVLTLLIFRSSNAWVFYQGAREEGR
jgi:multiple sugar transport system permease protein